MSYFSEKVADLCDKLSYRLRHMNNKPIEEEIEAEVVAEMVEEKKVKYTKPNEYNDNNLREIIPILNRADYSLELALIEESKVNAKKAIESLTENLSNIERKRKEFNIVMDNIAKSPNSDEYRLMKSDKTNDVILFNPNYELNNVMRNHNVYPSVVAIDCTTNEPKAYTTIEKMIESNPKYASLSKDNKEPYSIDELKKEFQTVGMTVFGIGDIPKAISVIDNIFNEEANHIKERIAKNENMIKSTDLTERVSTIAKYYSDNGVSYLPNLNQAVLFSDTLNSRMMLNYDYELGLINAYFKDDSGQVSQVYDIRDASNGFAYLENKEYQKIINDAPFQDLIATVGMELNYEGKSAFDYNGTTSFIGVKEFKIDDIGLTEVPNKTFSYSTEYSEALHDKMVERMEEYMNAVPDDVIVAYNKFNNTINLFSNGGQVSITFDEFGNRMDIFYKKENEAIVPTTNPIIFDNHIKNEYAKKVLNEDENFKYITQNLAFGAKDIAFGNAGKPLSQIKENKNETIKPTKNKSDVER